MWQKQKWWGYVHIDGSLHVKRFFSQEELDEAHESDFVDEIVEPFWAAGRQAALKHLAYVTNKRVKYMASVAEDRAKGNPPDKPCCNHMKDYYFAMAALWEIHDLLNGTEWDSETTGRIAEIVVRATKSPLEEPE